MTRNSMRFKQTIPLVTLSAALTFAVPCIAQAETMNEENPSSTTAGGVITAGLDSDFEETAAEVIEEDSEELAAKQSGLVSTKTETEEDVLPSELHAEAISVSKAVPEVPLKDHDFVIESAVAGRGVVDVKGGSTQKRANVQLYAANGSAAQEWSFIEDKGGYVIKNKKSGLVLDVASGKAKNGSNVQQWTRNGSAAQRWYVDWIDEVKGQAYLRSALAGNFVLDVCKAGTTNGTNLQIFRSNGSSAQVWNLIDVLKGYAGLEDPGEQLKAGSSSQVQPCEGSYTFTAHTNTLGMDVAGGSLKSGAKVQLYRKNNSLAQGFYLSREGNFWRIRNDKSGLSVATSAADIVAGTGLTQQTCQRYNQYQLWELMSDGVGNYYIINAKTRHALATSGPTLITADVAAGISSQRWSLAQWCPEVQSGFYRVTSGGNANQVLDVQLGSTKEGANVQSYTWNGGQGQRWYFDRSGSAWQVRNVGSGLYLSHDGSNVRQSAAEDAASFWTITFSLGDLGSRGGFSFMSSLGSLLDIAGNTAKKGANIELSNKNSSTSQVWNFSSVAAFDANGWYEIRSLGDGTLSLDVKGGSGAEGANVQLYRANNSAAQTWHISSLDDGWYRVVSARSNKALGVAGSSISDGTNVAQYQVSMAQGQKWKLIFGKTGFVFLNALGKALDVSGGNCVSGQNVQQYRANGTIAQGWLLRKSSAKGIGSAIEKFSQRMVAIANDDKHGYDQGYRWGEYGDYDCSSLVISSLRAAGFQTGPCSWTGDMRSNLSSRGWDVLYINDVRNLQAGDVLLSDQYHTAGIVSNTTEVAAHQNERGGIVGGRPGDQTGNEICTRALTAYSSLGGWMNQWWDVVLRPTAKSSLK